MKYLIVLLALSGSNAFAKLDMKPGLWNITTKMKDASGKEYDPQAQMKAAMAKMTPEQKKQMEAMTANMAKKLGQDPSKSAFGMSDQGMQVCYSSEMLNDENAFARQKAQPECETTVPTRTSNHVIAEFKCKSGASGTAEWNIKDSTHYLGAVKMTGKDGKKTELNYEGTFASTDCGKVKPITEMMNQKPVKK